MGKGINFIICMLVLVCLVSAVEFQFIQNAMTGRPDIVRSTNQTGTNWTFDNIAGNGSQLTSLTHSLQDAYDDGQTLTIDKGILKIYADTGLSEQLVVYVDGKTAFRLGGGLDTALEPLTESKGWRPFSDNTYDFGAPTVRWRDGYFAGNLTSDNINISGSEGTVKASSNIDTSGDITIDENLYVGNQNFNVTNNGSVVTSKNITAKYFIGNGTEFSNLDAEDININLPTDCPANNYAYAFGDNFSTWYCRADEDTTYTNDSWDLSQIPTTGNVDLGAYNLTTTGTGTFGDLASGNAVITAKADGDIALKVKRASASGRSQIALTDQNDDSIWRFGTTGAGATTFSFYDGSATVLALDKTNDRVGINTGSPQQRFHIHEHGGTVHPNLMSSEVLLLTRDDDPIGVTGVVAESAAGSRVVFKGVKAGGTLPSPTRALDTYSTFSLIGEAYDGSSRRGTAGIDMTLDGTTSSGHMPQHIAFLTGETTGRTIRMIVKPDGKIGIGTLTPSTKLEVNGNITADNVFLPAYIRTASNDSQAVTTGSEWVNVTFDRKVAGLKQNIEHTFNDGTNTTFTINDGGVYSVSYRFAFVDSAPAPDAHVGMRLADTDGTITKGSYDEVDTYRTDEQVLNTHAFITEFNDGDEFTVQFTSDDTTISTEVHTTFEPSGSSVQLNVHKVANNP